MAVTSPTKLGPDEIESPLGAGGLGQEYRARDTRLNHLTREPGSVRLAGTQRAWAPQRARNVKNFPKEHHPEGNFYLHRYVGTREIWKRIGPGAQKALDAARF